MRVWKFAKFGLASTIGLHLIAAPAVTVFWSNDGPGYLDVLESSPDLKQWSAIPGPYATNQNNEWMVVVPPTNGARFFRVARRWGP